MDSQTKLDIDIRKTLLEVMHDYECESLEQRRKVVDIALKEVIEQAPNVIIFAKKPSARCFQTALQKRNRYCQRKVWNIF